MRRTAIMGSAGALVFALTAATAKAVPDKGRGKGSGTARVVLCYEGETVTVAAGSAGYPTRGHGPFSDRGYFVRC
ncbi:MAG: hypothetical protein AVDCRST_MAG25-3332 [uncultured Rubrobacteraceae bacterium]|uniref:Uncharacterized protein n=1 Tax=uncultured Rubrobacteraceae bacterium TaxID=349277 RepID=A0A6J4S612_9ACTN|nr:MAG: hypothetical protein AVDCRST_MAG25-3332 [uncultured Rubrobacteraceae bacterium]